jgi:hypothetical protein
MERGCEGKRSFLEAQAGSHLSSNGETDGILSSVPANYSASRAGRAGQRSRAPLFIQGPPIDPSMDGRVARADRANW